MIGSADPGAMLAAADAGIAVAVLVVLATVTTNFVNIYLSSLAWRSVMPACATSFTSCSRPRFNNLLSVG